jgi:hypothetical protein
MQPHLTDPGIDPELRLPTSEELPCSDDTPVDNESIFRRISSRISAYGEILEPKQ